MKVLQFFIGAFFALCGIQVVLFHDHIGRTPGFAILLIVVSLFSSWAAGGFLAGSLSQGKFLQGFSEYKRIWSLGNRDKNDISNAGACFLISLSLNLLFSNLIGL